MWCKHCKQKLQAGFTEHSCEGQSFKIGDDFDFITERDPSKPKISFFSDRAVFDELAIWTSAQYLSRISSIGSSGVMTIGNGGDITT